MAIEFGGGKQALNRGDPLDGELGTGEDLSPLPETDGVDGVLQWLLSIGNRVSVAS